MDDSTLHHSSPRQRQHNISINSIRSSQGDHQESTDITLIQPAIDPLLDSLSLPGHFNVIGNQQTLPTDLTLSELLSQDLEQYLDGNTSFLPQSIHSIDLLYSSELPENQTPKMSEPDESESVKKEQEEATSEEVAHSTNAQALESTREDTRPTVAEIDAQNAESVRQAIIDSMPRGDRLKALWGSLPSLNLTKDSIKDRARRLDADTKAVSNIDQSFRDHMRATEDLYPQLQRAIALSKGLPTNSELWTPEELYDIQYMQISLHIKARFEICSAFKVNSPPFRGISWPSDQLRLMLDVLQMARDEIVPRSEQDPMTVVCLKLSVMQWQLDAIQRWISGLQQPDNTAVPSGDNDNDNDDHQHRPGLKRSRSQGDIVQMPSKRRPGRPAGTRNKSSTKQEHDLIQDVIKKQRNPTATTAPASGSTRTPTRFPLDVPFDEVAPPPLPCSVSTSQPRQYFSDMQQPQGIPPMDQRAPGSRPNSWLNPRGQPHVDAQVPYYQPQPATATRNSTSRHQHVYATPFYNIGSEHGALQQFEGEYSIANDSKGFLGQHDQPSETQQQTAQMPYYQQPSSFPPPRNDMQPVPSTQPPPASAAQQDLYGIEGRGPYTGLTANLNTRLTAQAQARNIDNAQSLTLNTVGPFTSPGWNPNVERRRSVPANPAETYYTFDDWQDDEEQDELGSTSRGEQGNDQVEEKWTQQGKIRRKSE